MINEYLSITKYSKFNYNNTQTNIAIITKGKDNLYVPTAYIRLLLTFNYISNIKEYNVCLIDEDEFNLLNKRLDYHDFFFDIVIIQRDVLNSELSKKVISISKLLDNKIFFEIDDDLLNINHDHPEYSYYKDKIDTMEYIIKNSDVVTVTNNCLKEKILNLNSNVVIIPNVITFPWKNTPIKLNKKQDSYTIGYMGSTSHKSDIVILKNVVPQVIEYFKNKGITINFEIIGATSEKLDWCENHINIPNDKKQYPIFIEWLNQIVKWDLALAPLNDTPINQSKSQIKYLEYSSLGVPGIYSNIGPYKENIQNNITGILLDNNDTETWTNSIIKTLENTELRTNIIKNARNELENKYNIKSTINHWIDLINNHKRDKSKLLYSTYLKFQNSYHENFLSYLEDENYNIIKNSGLFDEEWYLSEYVDVKINNLDPIMHFIKFGVEEKCNPNKTFDIQKYIKNQNILSGINPLTYYILKNQEYSDTNKSQVDSFSLFNQINNFKKFKIDNITSNIILRQYDKVTIIVPIYNAYEDTKKCIESIFRNTHNFKLILINDNSTDSRIEELLSIYDNYENVTVYNNSVNNGFTKNVNFGIRNSGDNDVVLLNSDTMVSSNWLEKIVYTAYSQSNIATVTPFSNASDISIPVTWNNKPSFQDVDNLGLIVANINNINEKLYAPTGNGYCLYIKREAINDVGLFDEKNFGKGYGEESDFTMRAKKRGWKNCRLPSVFVYHKKSASFSSNSADKLKKEHKQIILDKHPRIFKEWDEFYHSDKLQNIIKNITYHVNLNHNKKNVLVITTIKNNLPFIDNYYELKEDYNILCLSIDKTLKLWLNKGYEEFILIEDIKIDDSITSGHMQNWYMNLFAAFNIYDVYINHTIIIKELDNFYDLIPLLMFEKSGINIIYTRPDNLTEYTINSVKYNKNPKIDFENKKCVVYTAITGNYDYLNDPDYIDPNFDYICFTDNPNLKSNVWDIRLIDSGKNIIKTARKYKILPHKLLKEYDYSFWIDGSFNIIGNLREYVYKYLDKSSMIAVKHIRRDCIYDESEACIRNKKDDSKIIQKQIHKYRSKKYPKHNGLIESGFLFRIHEDIKLQKLMEDWYDEVNNNSIRDQISFNYVAWKNNYHYDLSNIIIWKNQYIKHNMYHN